MARTASRSKCRSPNSSWPCLAPCIEWPRPSLVFFLAHEAHSQPVPAADLAGGMLHAVGNSFRPRRNQHHPRLAC
ncbi:MAG TPA: hypothetical protein DDZ58_12655, partial [Achromobacter sp.]|nr:hypothetical protein [Achromobacter sp.]